MSRAKDLDGDLDRAPDQVEVWLAECLERAPQERKARLQELCSDHPEQAAALRRRWRALTKLGLIDRDGE